MLRLGRLARTSVKSVVGSMRSCCRKRLAAWRMTSRFSATRAATRADLPKERGDLLTMWPAAVRLPVPATTAVRARLVRVSCEQR